MDQTYLTPVKIKINGKTLFISTSVRIYEGSSDKEGGDSDNWSGTVIDINKVLPMNDLEVKQAEARNKGDKGYDAFFQQMLGKVNDPTAHIPVNN